MSYPPRLAESTVIPPLEVMQSKCSDLMNKKQTESFEFSNHWILGSGMEIHAAIQINYW